MKSHGVYLHGFFVFMCHRITGSGASFENDHGYRNNIMQYWGTQFGKLGVKKKCVKT